MKSAFLDFSSRSKRRRTPVADRARWVHAWERSGLTQLDFAQANNLSVGTLRNWVRRLGGSPPEVPKTCAFQEIQLGEMIGAPIGGDSTVWEAEIRLPSGVVVSVARGTSVTRVRELVEAVRC